MSKILKGIGASAGIAIAPAFLRPAAGATGHEVEEPSRNPEAEARRYATAIAESRAELIALRDSTKERLGDLKAEIFDAHLSMLGDPELAAAVDQGIRERGLSARAALSSAIQSFTALLSEIDGELFKARADDLRDLADRIAAHLGGLSRGNDSNPWTRLESEAVIVAEGLTPSETTLLDPRLVKAFVTSGGSLTSHSSILARSLQLPAVVGIGSFLSEIGDRCLLIVDGAAGLVIVDPEPEELERYTREKEGLEAEAREKERFIGLRSLTKDGASLSLEANIGGPKDSGAAIAKGAEGVGLFRTEYLYMDRETLPSEEEQYEAYRSVLQAFAPRPVVIRTLDVGGDKGAPSLDLAAEANPFLGVRAIRLCFAKEDVFRTQLRALLRASKAGKLRVMFPMIATLGEFRAARRILEEEAQRLSTRGIPMASDIEIGLMVEIPAAAIMIDQFAREADFFSVGTNDLVQYSMAADRTNPNLAYLNNALHPAILRILGRVAETAERTGRSAAVCGEMAADPEALPLLVGMGFGELSMNAAAIPATRAMLSHIDQEEAHALYLQARELESAEEVRDLVRGANNKARGEGK